MPANTVKVDRSTKWGNPYKVGRFGIRSAEESVTLFRHLCKAALKGSPELFSPLRGKNLACWCKPGDSCHADVLIEIANRE